MKKLSIIGLLLLVGLISWGQDYGFGGDDQVGVGIRADFHPVLVADSEEQPGFRGIPWRSSKKNVIDVEGQPLDSDAEILLYRDIVANMETYVMFEFYNNMLTAGMYSFLHEHSNRNKYVDDFIKLKELLVSKYGKPEKESENVPDYYKENDSIGDALAYGKAYYRCFWSLGPSEIILSLHGGNYGVTLNLVYCCYDLYKEMEAKREEAEKEKL